MTTILDTGIVIDHLRGDEEATRFVVNVLANDRAACSRLTMIELAVGMRPHQGLPFASFERFVEIIDVDERIGQRAEALAREWGASHGSIDVTDYVIAATAQVLRMDLATRNVKRFPMFEGLAAPY
jgi:predicted nucleic acid-binding protein